MDARSLKEIAASLMSAERASPSLSELSGMAGLLVVEGLRGGHEASARTWIVDILNSPDAHTVHVQAMADALVNHLVPLWDEARDALKARLHEEDKYAFMSALTPLLFDASSLDAGLEQLRPLIPESRRSLAGRLVEKIKQAGRS